MTDQKQYEDYTLDEKLIYARGWNAAITKALQVMHKAAESKDIRSVMLEVLELDKSMQATDD